MNNIIKKCLIFFIMISGSIAQAEIYKWVDENGRTHYGEKPAGAEASKIEIKDATPVENEATQNIDRDKLLEIYEEERRQKKEMKLEAEENKKKIEKRCNELKNDIADLQQGGTVFYELDENGERKYMSDEELTGQIKKMQAEYNKNCK